MRKMALALCGIIPMTLSPALAQEVSVPSVTTASPSGYTNPLKLDTDRYDRERRAKSGTRAKARRSAPPRQVAEACSADTVPASEQRLISEGYMRLAEAEGERYTDIWYVRKACVSA